MITFILCEQVIYYYLFRSQACPIHISHHTPAIETLCKLMRIFREVESDMCIFSPLYSAIFFFFETFPFFLLIYNLQNACSIFFVFDVYTANDEYDVTSPTMSLRRRYICYCEQILTHRVNNPG